AAAAGPDARDARDHLDALVADREEDFARADQQAARILARRLEPLVARARPRALRPWQEMIVGALDAMVRRVTMMRWALAARGHAAPPAPHPPRLPAPGVPHTTAARARR